MKRKRRGRDCNSPREKMRGHKHEGQTLMMGGGTGLRGRVAGAVSDARNPRQASLEDQRQGSSLPTRETVFSPQPRSSHTPWGS